MLPRHFTGFIDENECMGDTLGPTFGGSPGTINENFYDLDTAAQKLSATFQTTVSKDNYNTLIRSLTGLGTGSQFYSLTALILP